MQEKFYRYVSQRIGLLVIWGSLNVLVGGLLSLFTRDKFWRQFWLQCMGWGTVNSLIGWFSRRSYQSKLAHLTGGDGWKKEVRNVYLILFANVFLDAGYAITGGWLRRKGRTAAKPGQAGIGLAFIVQGLFLFLFDAFLTLEIKRRWRKSQDKSS